MRAYLMTVIWAAVAGTLAELMGDDEGNGAKLLRLLTGLMILSVVISPLRGLLQTGPEALLDRLQGIYEDTRAASAEAGETYTARTLAYIRTTGEVGAGDAVAELVADRFDLPGECCRAAVELAETEGEFSLSAVRVVLSGRGVLTDPYAVEAYLEDMLGCSVEVSVE